MNRRSLRLVLLLVLAVLVPVRAWAVDRMLLASPVAGSQSVRLAVAAVAAEHADCVGHAAAHAASHDDHAGHAAPAGHDDHVVQAGHDAHAGHDGAGSHIHCLLCVLIGLPAAELPRAMTGMPQDLPRQHLSTWRNAAPAPLFKPPIS